MKTLSLSKTLNFKRTLAAAALALATLAYAAPGQATPHWVGLDFTGSGTCSASIYDSAAKYSSCTLKARSKAAKRGIEPDFAACDAKMVRWSKKSEKACCSVHQGGSPEVHEACLDELASVTEAGGPHVQKILLRSIPEGFCGPDGAGMMWGDEFSDDLAFSEVEIHFVRGNGLLENEAFGVFLQDLADSWIIIESLAAGDPLPTEEIASFCANDQEHSGIVVVHELDKSSTKLLLVGANGMLH